VKNDALLINVDQIRFGFPKKKKMKVYALGLAADNLGKIILTSPPAVTPILHRPKLGRPAVWDFGGDGYSIYQRVGGLDGLDFIAAHLIVVRDRSNLRNTGDLLSKLSESDKVKEAAKKASEGLAAAAGGPLGAALGVGLVQPVLAAVGDFLSNRPDKVISTLSGSIFLDADRKEQDELEDTIRSPDQNVELDVDALLFDGTASEDFEAVETPNLGIELAGLVGGAAAGGTATG